MRVRVKENMGMCQVPGVDGVSVAAFTGYEMIHTP